MRHTIRAIALILVVALSAPAYTVLASTTRVRPKRPQTALAKIFSCLHIVNLTDEQKSSIRGILESVQPTLSSLADTLRVDQATLQSLLDADSPDPCAIGSATLTVREDRAAIEAEVKSVLASINALLTPGQQSMLAGCLHAPPSDMPASE